ncbi:hypothetical protein [Bifidobacterium olomucense]|uniref:Uncharacterized protein n=1 Tax=Bifidobacterium olomucense TaxID=2675324 RepID=A0A7Y0HYH5_9BIFI|nr:hypothetical protein [Bifidobacterium sp. DSM 109959]NMM99347.1 hypothetical protein [Bifidobacterium sp. DSM 109959]
MSEPFWEGKTLKELEGKRIRAACDEFAIEGHLTKGIPGTLVIEITNRFLGEVFHEENGFAVPTEQSRPTVITLLDDPDYDRIGDFDDVRAGDIAVFSNGNRHQVTDVDPEDRIIRLRAIEAPAASVWADDRMFAYALRPKPQLPDKPGLWVDKNGDLWVFAATDPNVYQGTRLRHDGAWAVTGQRIHTYTDMFAGDNAPFHPYNPEVKA